LIEVAVVLDRERRPLFWHEPEGAGPAALPDSRALWDVLWAERHRLSGVAHLHPGRGGVAPSREDLTTFAACEAGLGVRLEWWIASADRVRCFGWAGAGPHDYQGREANNEAEIEGWLEELRRRGASGRQS
jgi:hypothetical protein